MDWLKKVARARRARARKKQGVASTLQTHTPEKVITVEKPAETLFATYDTKPVEEVSEAVEEVEVEKKPRPRYSRRKKTEESEEEDVSVPQCDDLQSEETF